MNWIPFKQWRFEEARRQGVQPVTIIGRVCRGLYPGLRVRRVNSRVIFVLDGPVTYSHGPRKGEVRLRDWVNAEAGKEHVSRQAIWMRLWRGKFYEPMKIRRVTGSVQFCRLTIPRARGGCAT